MINQQTFGGKVAQLVERYCQEIEPDETLDMLDTELMLRSKLDTALAGGPVNQDGGGGYVGLKMSVEDHLTILGEVGFTAGEVWRKGKSAIILAEKSAQQTR